MINKNLLIPEALHGEMCLFVEFRHMIPFFSTYFLQNSQDPLQIPMNLVELNSKCNLNTLNSG